MLAYEFGPMRLEVGQHALFCRGEAIPLAPRLFDILLVLVESQGKLVSQEALRSRVWPDSFVQDAAVIKNVSSLRAAMRGCLPDVEIIRTVPKRGYQFVLPVTLIENDGSPELVTMVTPPQESAAAAAHSSEQSQDAPERDVLAAVQGHPDGAELPTDTKAPVQDGGFRFKGLPFLRLTNRKALTALALRLAAIACVVILMGMAAATLSTSTHPGAKGRGSSRPPDSDLLSISTVDPNPTPVGATSLHQASIRFVSKVKLHPTLAVAIQVVTQGVPNADFKYADGGTCRAGATYYPDQTCTVNFTFSPRSPGQRAGAVLLQGESSEIVPVVTKMITCSGFGLPSTPKFGEISTVVGGAAHLAGVQLRNNQGIAIDPAGVLFIADASNQRVLRVANGIASQYGPDFSAPVVVALDGAGNVYVADFDTANVQRIDRAGHSEVVPGATGLRHINGMTLDAMANLYVSAGGLNLVRRISPDGSVRTVAGSGVEGYNGDNIPATSAQLRNPTGLAVDPAGNVFVEDTDNHRIRKIDTSGTIHTVAGTGVSGFSGDGGPAVSAKLSRPSMQFFLDSTGSIFFNDHLNRRVREVSASTGIISTVVGNGTSVPMEGVASISSGLNGNTGLAMDFAGNLYVSQNAGDTVQKVAGSPYAPQ